MDPAKWEEGIAAWTKVKAQAEIDIEQADLYIKAIKDHLSFHMENNDDARP